MKFLLPVILSGVLAGASPDLFDRVELWRVQNQGAEFAGGGVVRLAVEDCAWLGLRGLMFVSGMGVYRVHITDCQSAEDRKVAPLHSLGLVADVSDPDGRFNGKEAVVILWRRASEEQK